MIFYSDYSINLLLFVYFIINFYVTFIDNNLLFLGNVIGIILIYDIISYYSIFYFSYKIDKDLMDDCLKILYKEI